MKLTKSKQFLADAIHASGNGWPDGTSWAVQNGDHGRISFSENKPARHGRASWMAKGGFKSKIEVCIPQRNWHQTVLSREEYFSAYPAEPEAVLKQEPVPDADGWIEWLSDELPVAKGTIIDVKYSDGDELHGAPCGVETENLTSIRGDGASAELFGHSCFGTYIIAYRLHKPESKPDFCESVTRSIPEPDSKPSIEQLAAEYRNKLDYAERLQKEADAAKAAAEAKLVELVEAGKAHGLVIGISDVKPDLVITDWRGLRVGDEVECLKVNITGDDYADHLVGRKGVVIKTEPPMKACQPVKVEFSDSEAFWISEWKFIRRP